MKKNLTVSAVKIKPLFKILQDFNVDKNTFLKKLKIDPAIFDIPDKKLTGEQLCNLLNEAEAITNNNNIGLQLGSSIKYFPNLVCYIMMNCDTLAAALNKYSQYQKIFNEESRTTIKYIDNISQIEIISNNPDLSIYKHLIDFKLSSLYCFLEYLAGKKIPLVKLTFKYSTPEDGTDYNNMFNCPVIFNSNSNSIFIEKELLELPLLQPNQELVNIFEKQAQVILNKIQENETYSQKVCNELIKTMPLNSVTIKDVSKQLNMSVRKLQMLLECENTSFTLLANKTRKELALYYLKDKYVSIDEAAYLLGFSEASSFRRAFKKWTGYPPGYYKENIIVTNEIQIN